MTAIQLAAKTPITYRNQYGQIGFANNRSVLIELDDGHDVLVSGDEFRDMHIAGEVQFVRRKRQPVLTVFSNDTEAKKFELLRAIVHKLDESATPFCRKSAKKLILEQAQILNWPDKKPFSDSTLFNHYREWVKAGRNDAVLGKKNKVVRQQKGDTFAHQLMVKVVDEVYLQLKGPTCADTYRNYEKQFDILESELIAELQAQGKAITQPLGKKLGKSSFYNYVDSLDPFEVEKARNGLKAARRKFRSRSNKFITYRPMECVQLDALHLQIGVRVYDDATDTWLVQKPIVYMAIDTHTRVIVGYYICVSEKAAEKSSAVINLLKHMMNPDKSHDGCRYGWPLSGAPDLIMTDGGKAFTSHRVKSVMAHMGTSHEINSSASPWKNAFIERFNLTVKQQFARNLPGYVGNRIRGEYAVGTIEKLAVLTKEEFIASFERYILDYYHQNPHRGLDHYSPYEYWEMHKGITPPVDIEKWYRINAFKGIEYKRSLTATGVNLFNLEYSSDELRDFFYAMRGHSAKKKISVTVLTDYDDISTVSVENNLTGELIEAKCTHQRVTPGMSRAEARKLFKENPNKTQHFECPISRAEARARARKAVRSAGTSESYDMEEMLSKQQLDSQIANGNGKGANDYSGRVTQAAGGNQATYSDNDDAFWEQPSY